MSVALFHPAFQTIGGAEILVASQAQCLKRAGLQVSVVTLSLDRDRWSSWFEGISVRVVPKGAWIDVFSPEVHRLRRSIPRIEASLADCRAVLTSNFPSSALLGASRITGRRIWVCTEPPRHLHVAATNPRLHERMVAFPNGATGAERHYASLWAKQQHALKRSSHRGLVDFDLESTKSIDETCGISQFSRDMVRRVYGRTDVGVIYPVVRFPSEAGHRRSGIRRTGLRILTHSRLEAPKNVDTVLRGFALFLKKESASQLHVVGEGKAKKSLERLASELGIAGAVRFHGYLPDQQLREVYDACDVFALLPIDEPFGMVFPEAAARGLLMVASDHGGPFEIVDGGRLGWANDPFSPEALADSLHQVVSLSDTEVDRRRSLADEACRSRYSEAVIGPQLVRAVGGSRRFA